MMKSIVDIVKSEVNDFIDNHIEVVPGYDFSQYDTIQRIHLYQNSQFEDQTPYAGREKIFFNISNPRKDTVVRFLDIDTKDIRPFEIEPRSEVAASILKNELQRYLKVTKFTHKLNNMADELCTYGSLVLKHTQGEPQIVDLRRLFLDPTVESIKDSRFITLKHFFTPEELREIADSKAWDKDKVETIIAKKERMQQTDDAPYSYERDFSSNEIKSTPLIEVYERYGTIAKGQLDGTEDEQQVPSVVMIAEPFLQSKSQSGKVFDEGEVLYKAEWKKKEYPFRDVHFLKTRGRWLGIGVFEALFPEQERINELANQKRVSMEISSMHLFQTADPTVLNNLLNDAENGDVFQTKGNGIQPIVNEERNLPAFNQEQQEYLRSADRKSFANDFISGADVPSSLPATNAVIQQNNAASVHLFKRENFAFFIRDYINEFVLPQLIKDLDQDRVLRVVGTSEDFFKLDNLLLKKKTRDKIIQKYLEGEPVLSPFLEDIKTEVQNEIKEMGSKRFVKFFKGYMKDKKIDIDINIDNEQRDTAKIANNTFSFLQIYAANPALMQDPVGRQLLMSYSREIGIDTGAMELAFAQQDAQQPAQGQLPEEQTAEVSRSPEEEQEVALS